MGVTGTCGNWTEAQTVVGRQGRGSQSSKGLAAARLTDFAGGCLHFSSEILGNPNLDPKVWDHSNFWDHSPRLGSFPNFGESVTILIFISEVNAKLPFFSEKF